MPKANGGRKPSFTPDLNYHNPEVKEAMFDVIRFWLDKGVDGFHLDIISAIYEDSELRSNPSSPRLIPSVNQCCFPRIRKALCINYNLSKGASSTNRIDSMQWESFFLAEKDAGTLSVPFE